MQRRHWRDTTTDAPPICSAADRAATMRLAATRAVTWRDYARAFSNPDVLPVAELVPVAPVVDANVADWADPP
jgi:hypothetical protein